MSTPEDKESQLRQQRNARALLLQRKQRLIEIAAKRKMNMNYLRRAHEGGIFWFGTTLLTLEDVKMYVQGMVPKQRAVHYFYLAISIAKLLDSSPHLTPGLPMIRAWAQLMEEWEYFSAGAATQGVRFLSAKACSSPYPNSSRRDVNSEVPVPGQTDDSISSNINVEAEASEPLPNASSPTSPDNTSHIAEHASSLTSSAFKDTPYILPATLAPSLRKFNGSVVYEHLLIPHIPFEINYLQVLPSLCDALCGMYQHILHQDGFQYAACYELILKIDQRVKSPIIATIAREITELCNAGNAEVFEQLRTESVPSWGVR